jgi:DNA replication protein DnaC
MSVLNLDQTPRKKISLGSIENCPRHGDYEPEIAGKGKFQIKRGCPKCIEEAARTAEDSERYERVEKLKRECCIPKRFLDSSFESYRLDTDTKAQALALKICKAYAARFDDRLKAGGGLVLCGTPGTGKTHLACAIANAVMSKGLSVVYTTAFRMMDEIKGGFNAPRGGPDPKQKFESPRLLILDEIGVQFGTDAEKILAYQVINTRYENVLPTIAISNKSEKELSSYIDERTIDRLREGGGAVINFTWASNRK